MQIEPLFGGVYDSDFRDVLEHGLRHLGEGVQSGWFAKVASRQKLAFSLGGGGKLLGRMAVGGGVGGVLGRNQDNPEHSHALGGVLVGALGGALTGGRGGAGAVARVSKVAPAAVSKAAPVSATAETMAAMPGAQALRTKPPTAVLGRPGPALPASPTPSAPHPFEGQAPVIHRNSGDFIDYQNRLRAQGVPQRLQDDFNLQQELMKGSPQDRQAILGRVRAADPHAASALEQHIGGGSVPSNVKPSPTVLQGARTPLPTSITQRVPNVSMRGLVSQDPNGVFPTQMGKMASDPTSFMKLAMQVRLAQGSPYASLRRPMFGAL